MAVDVVHAGLAVVDAVALGLVVDIVAPQPFVASCIAAESDIENKSHVLERLGDVAGALVEEEVRSSPRGWVGSSIGDVLRDVGHGPGPDLESGLSPLRGVYVRVREEGLNGRKGIWETRRNATYKHHPEGYPTGRWSR